MNFGMPAKTLGLCFVPKIKFSGVFLNGEGVTSGLASNGLIISPPDEVSMVSFSHVDVGSNGVVKMGDGIFGFKVVTGVGNCVVNGVFPGCNGGDFLVLLL